MGTIRADDGPRSLAWSHWKFAVGTAVVTAGIGLVAVFSVLEFFGLHGWLPMGDAKWTVESTQYVSWGGTGGVYSANPLFIPLPGYLFLLAPFVALGDHLGFVNNVPWALPYPSMWKIVAPVFFVTGSTAILGVDYLADTLGVTKRRRRWIAVGMGLTVVLPTVGWAGHPEDLVALALSSLAVALFVRRRRLGAALVLSVAVLMQPWAGLLIPILVGASRPGTRLRALLCSSALPGSCALLMLALDFRGASAALIKQPMLGNGQRLPWWSWSGHMSLVENGVTMAARVGSGTRSLAVLTALVLALWVTRNPSRQRLLIAVSVVLLARGVSELQIWPWYLAPAAAFMTVSSAAFNPASGRRWVVGGVGAFVLYGFSAAAYNGVSMPSLLGLAVLLLAAGTSFSAMRRRAPLRAVSAIERSGGRDVLEAQQGTDVHDPISVAS